MRKYKIGITFNLEAKVTDIWANGANQNVIHLFHLFQHSSIVEDVILVSWGPEKRTTPPEGLDVYKRQMYGFAVIPHKCRERCSH